jgi:hypothetical protein
MSGNTPRKFLLDNFKINAKIISKQEYIRLNNVWTKIRRRLSSIFTPENSWVYNKKYLKAKDGDYKIGYWQSEKYFKEISDLIRKEITLKRPMCEESMQMLSQIQRSDIPISLHIRRTDYMNDPLFRESNCNLEYYKGAIKYMKDRFGDNIVLFISSDDIGWVKENFLLDNAVYISNPNIPDYEELILMSKCKHHIIANSTFSWWGAWLNPDKDKVVIAPRYWTSPKIPSPDIIPDTWIKI